MVIMSTLILRFRAPLRILVTSGHFLQRNYHVSHPCLLRSRVYHRPDVPQLIPPNATSVSSPYNLEPEGVEEDQLARITGLSEEWDADFVEDLAAPLTPSFNLATFIDKSETLQQLVKLGVNLSKIEEKREVCEFLLTLDFEKNIRPYIQFLVDIGIHPDDLGHILTENPMILDEMIENLEIRLKYLRAKKFEKRSIIEIIKGYPGCLSKSVKDVDAKLGLIQREYNLSGGEVRHITTLYPKVLRLHQMQIRVATFAFLEEMGFTRSQLQMILIQMPQLLGQKREMMVHTFDYLHNYAKVKHDLILQFPEILRGDLPKIKKRCTYLQKLKRDQFDPTKPLFVPLSVLSEGDDVLFASKYAKTSIEDYNYYLKTV